MDSGTRVVNQNSWHHLLFLDTAINPKQTFNFLRKRYVFKEKAVKLYIFVLVALLLLAACERVDEKGIWEPSSQPDPAAILNSAREDAEAGEFVNALRKHEWFHQNALKYQKSLYGVRLSFALADWNELAQIYEPAFNALLETANKEKESFLHCNAITDCENCKYDAFHTYESINDHMGRQEETVELFKWVYKNEPSVAKKVFSLAEEALIESKEFALINEFLNSQNEYQRILGVYKSNYTQEDWPAERIKAMEEFAYGHFTHHAAMLVALLAINNRSDEAAMIASLAKREISNEPFDKLMEAALKGNLPEKPYQE